MKPEIGFVTDHCCVRVVKEAVALKQLGYNVHLFSKTLTSVNNFASVHYFNSPYQLEQAIKLTKEHIDIWQVHNEPNWPPMVVRRVAGDAAKIVLDYHDSNHWRLEPGHEITKTLLEDISWFNESTCVKLADAFVVPSEPCATELKTRTTKPVVVTPSAANQMSFRYMEVPFMGGLASQGGHSISSTSSMPSGEHWRDFIELYSGLKGRRQVYAYCPSFTFDQNNPLDKAYSQTGARLGRLNYDELLDTLPRHTWNLCGNLSGLYLWKNFALPNKFFDAIAAGVPSMVLNCGEAAKIVEKYDIGIVVNSADEMVARWGEHEEKRANLFKYRHELCMEALITPQTELYKGLA